MPTRRAASASDSAGGAARIARQPPVEALLGVPDVPHGLADLVLQPADDVVDHLVGRPHLAGQDDALGTALPFVVVSLLTLAVLLIGYRLVLALLHHLRSR